MKSAGQVAFEDWVSKNKGKFVGNTPSLTSWEGLPQEKKDQWEAAVKVLAHQKQGVREGLASITDKPKPKKRKRRYGG